MKSLYQYIIAILSLLVISSGCKKQWLEAKVDKRQAVPAVVKDFQAILDDITFNYSQLMITEVASDGHYFTDDMFASFEMSGLQSLANAYTWSKMYPYQNDATYESQMSDFYYQILRMNVILEESKKSRNEEKSAIDGVRAQALFHRARLYFELSQVFAAPYDSATANTDLGLPLRLSTDLTERSKRSTIAETYQQIIDDLLAAKDALVNTPLFVTRASKPAALALLAKVYLAMDDYENAYKYSNECLAIRSGLLDYSEVVNSASIGLNKEVLFLTMSLWGPYFTTFLQIDRDLYNSYDGDDLRKQLFFTVQPEGIAFKGSYTNDPINEPFLGLAIDEVYLIRAECLARTGDLAGAMTDLNDLLRNRWSKNPDGSTKYVDQTALNETDALTKILAERRKQLILRTNVRWTDLRRLNSDDRFKTTLSRTVAGNNYTLEPGDYRYTFPIPYQVIEKTNIEQNPGW